MSQTVSPRSRWPVFLKIWFGLDLCLVLLPPLHWWTSGAAPLFGVPRVLAYLFGSSIIVVASVIVAYLVNPDDRAEGARR